MVKERVTLDESGNTRASIGLTDSDVSAIRKLRARERIGRFFRLWWVPLISGILGFAGGVALTLAAGDRNADDYVNSYPYAMGAVGLSALMSEQGVGRRGAAFKLSVISIVAFAIAFVAGIGVADVFAGEGDLGLTTRYGVHDAGR